MSHNYDHFATPTSALVHTSHGAQPVGGIAPVGVSNGIAAASWSTAPYVGRGSKCQGNENTCGANRVKGEDFCAGHLRSVGKVVE